MQEYGPQRKTTRQEWSEISDFIQQDVDATLARLQSEIEDGNRQLAELYAKNPAQYVEYATKLIAHLDSEWGYVNDHFMVLGKWLKPEVKAGYNGIVTAQKEVLAFERAISDGFAIQNTGEKGATPTIGLSFLVNSHTLCSTAIRGNVQLFAYANPGDVSLQFLQPGNERIVSSDTKEVERSIHQADTLFRRHLGHKDSTFYQGDGKEQHALLRSIVDIVDESLPVPDADARAMLQQANPSHLYARSDRSGKMRKVSATNDANTALDITGEILGATTLDTILRPERDVDQPYRTPDELIVATTGLMLVVKPHTTSIDPSLHVNNSDLIIPVRALKTLPLHVTT